MTERRYDITTWKRGIITGPRTTTRFALFATLVVLGVLHSAEGQVPQRHDRHLAIDVLSEGFPVHIFYYAWWGAPGFYDGGKSAYREWDHDVLPHWDEREGAKYSSGSLHEPPEDIASAFYPSRGIYSSLDGKVVRLQMKDIADAGISVVIFSWWRNMTHSDVQGRKGLFPGTDGAASHALDGAQEAGIKICFHLEPYNGRTIANVREDIALLFEKYGSHPALLRVKDLPVFYIYDSYHLPIESWKDLLLPSDGIHGKHTVRGTHLDGIYIGLYLNRGNERYASEGGFDGLYTYFASTAFSDGTRLAEWPRLTAWAQQNSKLFVPCVGPGYDDSRVRPWNAAAWRYRSMGNYYDDMWAAAIEANPKVIAITSYNEWTEGTQIEAARSGRVSNRTGYRYQEYGPDESLYMRLTKTWALRFRETLTHRLAQERHVVREAFVQEDRRLHLMQQAVSAQASELYKASSASAAAPSSPADDAPKSMRALVQVHREWQLLQSQRQELSEKASALSLQLDTLPVVTLGEGLAEYADMLQHTAATAEASGGLPSPAGQPASTASAAAAAGGGAEGNRSGEGVGAQEREAAHRNIRHIKEACDMCYSPLPLPDEHRTEQCLACAGSSSHDLPDMRTHAAAGHALGREPHSQGEHGGAARKRMWEEQQLQQQQLALQQQQWQQHTEKQAAKLLSERRRGEGRGAAIGAGREGRLSSKRDHEAGTEESNQESNRAGTEAATSDDGAAADAAAAAYGSAGGAGAGGGGGGADAAADAEVGSGEEEFHELRQQVADMLELLRLLKDQQQQQHKQQQHKANEARDEGACKANADLAEQVAALKKRADDADVVAAQLSAELRQLKQKTQDNGEAALRNRKAIAETRRNYALIAQAFQNSATALASAATSPE